MSVASRLKKYYLKLAHKYRRINFIDDENVNLKVLRKDISDINKNEPLGTSSWENNRKEIRKEILEGDVANFLNWKVVIKTMFFIAPEVEYRDVISNKLLSGAINEVKVGNSEPYYLDTSTSGNLVHHTYSIHQLFKKTDLEKIGSIVEVGGGYGSMCRLFRNMKFTGNYTIFDLPEFSALQRYYSSSINEKYIENAVFTDEISGIKTENPGVLFLATWSISEMLLDLRDKLFQSLDFDYCVIAFQEEFDGINNIEYFKDFKSKYNNIDFEISPIKHLKGHYYLIGTSLI